METMDYMEGDQRLSFLEKLKLQRAQKLEEKITEAGISRDKRLVVDSSQSKPAFSKQNFYSNQTISTSSRGLMNTKDTGYSDSNDIYGSKKNFFQTNSSKLHGFPRAESPVKYPQERFYHNAKLRMRHKLIFDKMVESDIKSLANCRKMTKNSEKILVKKLEENLELAFVSVDEEDKKKIGFEQIGRVLYLMDIFEVIQYTEDCKVVKNEFFTTSQQKQLRRYKEMEFHEAFFNILALDLKTKTVSETIRTDISYAFLRLLLDPRKLRFKEHLNMIVELLSPLGFYTGNEPIVCQEEGEEEKIEIVPVKEILKKFCKLRKSRLYHSKIGYLKPSKVEELQNKYQSEYTFNPKINETSKILDTKVSKKRRTRSRKATRDSRVSMMLRKEQERRDKIGMMKLEKENKEMAECTFQPLTNFTSKRRSKSNAQMIVDRLYTPEVILQKQHKMETIKKTKQQIKEQMELSQCTFHPKVKGYGNNRGVQESTSRSSASFRSYSKKAPMGYHKAVGRMRLANQIKQKKKRQLEHIPKGENYERRKREKVRVPRCAKDTSKKLTRKSKPFMFLDVNVAPGKTGRVGICEDDDPEEKARNFAVTFQLNENMEAGLCNLIEAYIQKKQAGELETEDEDSESSSGSDEDEYEEGSSSYEED